jgi:hypothetical protein
MSVSPTIPAAAAEPYCNPVESDCIALAIDREPNSIPAGSPWLLWVCAALGADTHVLRSRFRNPWVVLAAAHGNGVVLAVILLVTFGWGTEWSVLSTSLAATETAVSLYLGWAATRHNEASVHVKRTFWLALLISVVILSWLWIGGAVSSPDSTALGSNLNLFIAMASWVRTADSTGLRH